MCWLRKYSLGLASVRLRWKRSSHPTLPFQGFVLTMAVMYVALNLMIDILYGFVDPRVRLEA